MRSLSDIQATITERLAGLSVSARLLAGSLVVILGMTLFMVAIYAGRQPMAPLGLSDTMPTEARTAALAWLDARNIPYRDTGGDVLVPTERRYAILSQLQEAETLGAEHLDFETLIREDSPFLSRSQSRTRYQIAKMAVVERMLAGLGGVQRATVILDEPQTTGGIGRRVEPTASVTVLPEQAGLTQDQVDAVARLVAGAHAGLAAERVEVIDARTGAAHLARSSEDRLVDQHLDLQVETERLVREKIAAALDYIPGVRVNVNVMVDSRRVSEQRRSVDEAQIGPTRERIREVSSAEQPAPAEPGIRSNTGFDLGGATARATSYTESTSDASMVPKFGGTESHVEDHGGYARKINATVLVPRSYFLEVHDQMAGPDAAAPDAAQLAELITTESGRIQAQVEPLVDTDANPNAAAGIVHVSMIPDTARVTTVPQMTAPHSAATGWASFGEPDFLKNVGLAVLAVVSVAMMLLMVRRATARPELPTADELAGAAPPLADTSGDLLGDVTEIEPTLEGREVDEATVRRREMLRQINEMATETPGETARLVQRWVTT